VRDNKLTSRQKADLVVHAALNKKAIEPVILDLKEMSDLADCFVVVSGNTENQVRTIYQEIERVCREEGVPIVHVEGAQVGSWILIDLNDVVVHVFRQSEREFYDLESLWQRAPRLNLSEL